MKVCSVDPSGLMILFNYQATLWCHSIFYDTRVDVLLSSALCPESGFNGFVERTRDKDVVPKVGRATSWISKDETSHRNR